jgi:hypothetical protein
MSNIKTPGKKVSSQKRVYKKQHRKENGTNNSTQIFWTISCIKISDSNFREKIMILKGVRRCCVPNEMDGSDDSMLWNDSVEYENGSSQCTVDTVTLIDIFCELTTWN